MLEIAAENEKTALEDVTEYSATDFGDEARDISWLALLPNFTPLPSTADDPCTSSGTAWQMFD